MQTVEEILDFWAKEAMSTYHPVGTAKMGAASDPLAVVDNELRVPVYYASYGFPSAEGGRPVLLEEFAYSNIRLNVGLTNRDFDRNNSSYGFTDLSQTALGNR